MHLERLGQEVGRLGVVGVVREALEGRLQVLHAPPARALALGVRLGLELRRILLRNGSLLHVWAQLRTMLPAGWNPSIEGEFPFKLKPSGARADKQAPYRA